MQGVLRGVGAFRGDHLDEAETTALAGVWITHNVALLHVAVLFEELADLLLIEARVDAGDEEVGSWVDGLVIRVVTGWRCAAVLLLAMRPW